MKGYTFIRGFFIVLGLCIIGYFGLQGGAALDAQIEKDHTPTITVSSLPVDTDDLPRDSIIKVELETINSSYATTTEYYSNGESQVVYIPLSIYPNWRLADSLATINSRGTQLWIDIAQPRGYEPREYQVDVDTEGIIVYQGLRKVGKVSWQSNHSLDSLIAMDNQ